MDWYVRAFVRSAVVWLALGVTLGLAMALHPPLLVYRTVHLHMNLLGFMSMMVFGVGYHIFPRFAGVPLHDPRLAVFHWWVANAGLVLLSAGFALRYSGVSTGATALMGVGGGLSAVGAYCFAYLVWRTLGAAPPARVPLERRA
jgi:cbb3-type cytochrome oxidase subunit 1